MNHMYNENPKQKEKMNKLVSQIYNKDSNRACTAYALFGNSRNKKNWLLPQKSKASFNHLEVYLGRAKQKKQMNNKQYKM